MNITYVNNDVELEEFTYHLQSTSEEYKKEIASAKRLYSISGIIIGAFAAIQAISYFFNEDVETKNEIAFRSFGSLVFLVIVLIFVFLYEPVRSLLLKNKIRKNIARGTNVIKPDTITLDISANMFRYTSGKSRGNFKLTEKYTVEELGYGYLITHREYSFYVPKRTLEEYNCKEEFCKLLRV